MAGMRIGTYFTIEEFAKASDAPLTAAERESATWWVKTILDPLRAAVGRPIRISSFVRTVENTGPHRGGIERGVHGRHSTRPGNAVDIVIDGHTSANAVALIDRRWSGYAPLWAKLDGGNHVHLVRQEHPGSLGGAGREVRKADGTTGVAAIAGLTPPKPGGGALPLDGIANSGGGQPATGGGTGEAPPAKKASATLLVLGMMAVLVVVLMVVRRGRRS